MPSDSFLESQFNLSQAENALVQMLEQNSANNWPGIDRSDAGIAARGHAYAWARGNEALEGNDPPDEHSFFAKTMQHVILGNLTFDQAVHLDDILFGLAK